MGLTNHTAPSREHLFWAFCRIIANQTRLNLLFEIIRSSPLSVAQLSVRTGILENSASTHLKELHTYGLIAPTRRKQSVYYAIRENPPELYPNTLIPSLMNAAEQKTPTTSIIRAATAFTHQRRVEIVKMLAGHAQTSTELLDSSNIKRSALNRHLSKLIDRSFVVQVDSTYHLRCPENELETALLKAALL